MAAIRSLLNPMTDDKIQDSNEESKDDQSTHDRPASAFSDAAGDFQHKPNRKKQKICKDAAVFKAGTIRGECRYPPYEDQDEVLAAKHQMFEVYPVGNIASYPRHIPYNSEKKLYLEKTGRESFEVFQYQFKIPGDSVTYTMLWDYNIGLVRTTPLFKCGNYSKTTPAKMLSRNVGLKEICHSITGGALVAQGYWIPYEAAKAVAATFCWHIRYALTPVFGKDFPDTCLRPDSEGFGSMQIDPEITKRCAVQAQLYRELELQEAFTPSSGIPSPRTPRTPPFRPQVKKLLPKPPKVAETTSEYSTDSGLEDKYELSSPSPQIAFSDPWSAVNSPRSPPPKISFTNPWSPASTTRSESPHRVSRKGQTAANIPRSHTPLDLLPPPRKPLYPAINTMMGKAGNSGIGTGEVLPVQEVSPKSGAGRMDVDEDYDAGSDNSDAAKAVMRTRKRSSREFTETKAAYVLMKLRTQTDTVKAGLNSLKRRASA
ncbi:hypothetical protein A1O1_04939 [Capronia coronata CBS 617.96]|uniref:HTH APSES-type domain-containing protein n=1 Tax=Capronia coronata CBS 617.96 TaxID=1182541 RepID=W9Y5B8_9EURO|nr:uncharacterized protein A1O1_04939 [Capronia coronata CBS 617.96]EXJ88012.1 hypothetical protein A1O1_04939 [Capronia coronata CBS 617.96]